MHLWSTNPDLARGVVQPDLLYKLAYASTVRAARATCEAMIVIESTRFEGRFTIAPSLEAAKRYKLKRYLWRVEARRDRCPWRVADDGTSIIPRDAYTFGSGYDLWLVIVEQWLLSQGHVLSGFVRFYGAEPWDQGLFTADGRLILTRL